MSKWLKSPIVWFFVLLMFLLAVVTFAEDVRPDGTQATDGTDCTTLTAHLMMDNEVDDAWNTLDDCADITCIATQSSDFVSNMTFATPVGGNPTTGADDQAFAVRARKCDNGQTGTPQIRIDAYCNGVLVKTGTATNIAWNSGNGTVVVEPWTFNTTNCAASGSDVEVFVTCLSATGSPTTRVGCDFDAIEWRASVAALAARSRGHVIGG